MHGICLFLSYLCVTHKTLPRIFSYITGCSLTEYVETSVPWPDAGQAHFPPTCPRIFHRLSSPQTEAYGLRMAMPRAPDGQWMATLVLGSEKEREWMGRDGYVYV